MRIIAPAAFPGWRSPPANLFLPADAVHVWWGPLDVSPTVEEVLERVLTPDEVERADRFCFERDRLHFVVARGVLRLLLGKYLDLAARDVRFRYGPHGKPELMPSSKCWPLHFNVSHSGAIALYAFARGRRVGIDVELMRSESSASTIADRFFSPREAAALRSLPRHAQCEAFFHCWTRKEAYIKATGKGLSLPLDQFDVSVSPHRPAQLFETRWDREESDRWLLLSLPVDSGYAATLAVEGHGWQLESWQWSEGSLEACP